MWLTPRIGVIILDLCLIIGGFFSIWTVKVIGRKPLMIIGHSLVAIIFTSIDIFDR